MSGHLTLLSVICQPENRTYVNSLVQLVDEPAVRVTEFLNPLVEERDPSLVMSHSLHLPRQRHHAPHPHDQYLEKFSENCLSGQTMKYVGLWLRTPIFTHGQLYVACSR